MANLTRTAWPGGWNPSQSRNGDPDALLRMDNLQQEEDGSIGLVRGLKQIEVGSFPDFVSDIYTKTLGNQELLYVGLNNGAQVLAADINYTSARLLIEGGGSRPVFGASLGQVYACSGTKRIKDTGTGSGTNLGLATPTAAPTTSGVDQPVLSLSGDFTVTEGTGAGNQCFPDTSTLRGVVEASQGGANSLIISGSASDDPGSDRFHVSVQFENTDCFLTVRVEIVLDTDNYYWREWPVNNSAIKLGQGTWSTLTSKRNEFIRQGSDSTLDWKTISSIRITATGNVSDNWFGAANPHFTGGGLGQLNGLYEYRYIQVNDNGIYVAKSGPSPTSDPVLVFNGKVTINAPITDSQATDVWVYRRSLPTTENRQDDGTDTGQPIIPLLDKFYRVYPEGGVDNTSDIEALRLNDVLNEQIASVADITEPFIGMEGLVNERMLYLTKSFLYLSDLLNPDGYDTSRTIRVSGDPSEANLWVKQISNGLILLATTKDLYEITGTLLPNPDGTTDVSIKGLGERYPPICADFAFGAISGVGSIFYIAADGWHVTTGSNSALISPQLNKLFQGEDRYKLPAIKIYPGDVARYDIAIGRNKLYCISQHTDGTRRLIIYDILRKTWRLQYIDPVSICVTETDRVLLGFGGGSGNLLFEMEFGDDATVDSDEPNKGQGFILETVLDHNNQPRNRKDTFTLKLNMDTGGQDVSVYIAKDKADDDQDWVHLGDYSTEEQSTIFIKLAGIFVDQTKWNDPLGFRYALRITNKNDQIVRFKLYEYTIEYDPRPEQVNYLRIPNFNQGSYARKRWIAFAFTIDTLGHNVTFTPLIDNAASATSTVTKDGRLTYVHFFLGDTVGIDAGGILQSNNEEEPFEFYEVNSTETVTEKLPPSAKFWLIPQDDYGTPDRKRFTSYKFQINTRGSDVTFTPRIDGVDYSSRIFNTSEKRTVEYFFFDASNPDVSGVDIGGRLEGDSPFEFYGTIKPEDVEILPPRLLSFYIPTTNYGTPNRKRLTSHKFQINTNGQDVVYTPIVDGVTHIPSIVNTVGRRIHEHFFPQTLDHSGIDIGGSLVAQTDTPFEFYKVIEPQNVEILPPRLKSYYVPNNNLGSAAFKRIRTIPMVIDTGGAAVVFTPSIDGVDWPPATFVTLGKRTVLYYFIEDAFGVDVGGKLTSDNPFEFYGFGQFENVEVLPVGKKYDQLGPFRFDRIGKLLSFRTRLITQTFTIPYKIFSEDGSSSAGYAAPLFSSSFAATPYSDNTYQVDLPKNINGKVFRIILGPVDEPFFRYDMYVKVVESGLETDNKWVPLR